MDDNQLSTALSDESTGGGGGTGPQPAGDWISGVGNAPNVPPSSAAPPEAPDIGSSVPAPANPLGNIGQPDLPRFQRTFGNTLKGMLVGFGLGGIPGAVAGGVNPRGAQQAVQENAAMRNANQTFANARAAHEVAMAHQADLEYQYMPEKLQQEQESRGLVNLKEAEQAGFMPVAQIGLDQGQAQNSQNAMTALDQVKQQFGAVPAGLLYIHTGSGMTVMKLQDPNAALPAINQVRRAQGLPEVDAGVYATLPTDARTKMAQDAINFTSPIDPSGMVTQGSLNIASMRLATVKAQPDFTGKDKLVSQLQATVDHQKQVLDSGASQEAIRKGQATGAEAQAAQPGQTAAKVSEIKGTAGPEAAAAGVKAGAVAAAQFPYQAKLEQMKAGGNPVYAFDPKQNATVLTTKDEAQQGGMQAIRKVGESDIAKDTQTARQLGDAQLNVSAYRVASQKMNELSGNDIRNVARLTGSQEFKAQFLGAEVPMDWANELAKNDSWQSLPPDAKEAVASYIGARGAIIAYAKAISGTGRLTESQLKTETANLPDPTTPSDVREMQFNRFQRNIDQVASGLPKLPGVESPAAIRARIEGQAGAEATTRAAISARETGQYRNAKGSKVQVGQEVYDNVSKGYIGKVSQVYADGTYDVKPD